LLRRRVLVVLASSVVWASIWSYQPLGAHFPWLPAEWFVSALMAVTVTCIGIWLGLLPILVGFLTFGVMTTLPLDLLGATWHADAGIIALAATSTLVVFGVRTATRPMVR